ncbi:MAG: hypothetical protein ACFFDC_10765 [Promethearchaeota archaeon]
MESSNQPVAIMNTKKKSLDRKYLDIIFSILICISLFSFLVGFTVISQMWDTDLHKLGLVILLSIIGMTTAICGTLTLLHANETNQ